MIATTAGAPCLAPAPCDRADPKLLASEMGHFAEWAQNALLVGTKIDEYGDVFLDPDDRAEAMRVVDDPVTYGELIARWSDWILEGAGGQAAFGYR